jgi:hypothetical protein
VALDLLNSGSAAIDYDAQGCEIYDTFAVLGPDGRSVPYYAKSAQTFGHVKTLNPGQVVTLIAELDLSWMYLLHDPGTYHIRYGGDFEILSTSQGSDPKAPAPIDRGKHAPLLRSDWIRVEVAPGRPRDLVEVVSRLRRIAPPGWSVEGDGTRVLISHPKSNFWDKTLEIHFGSGDPRPNSLSLGRTAWGEIYLFSAWPGLREAWPDHRDRVREALGLD